MSSATQIHREYPPICFALSVFRMISFSVFHHYCLQKVGFCWMYSINVKHFWKTAVEHWFIYAFLWSIYDMYRFFFVLLPFLLLFIMSSFLHSFASIFFLCHDVLHFTNIVQSLVMMNLNILYKRQVIGLYFAGFLVSLALRYVILRVTNYVIAFGLFRIHVSC